MNIKVWFLALLLLAGCSSAPEHYHQVNTYHNIATQLMALADTKRQAQQFEQALKLYQQAYQYSVKRHDKALMVMSWLKSAAVHIQLQQLEQAQTFIAKARQLDLYEKQDFSLSIDFVEAKLWWQQGKTSEALGVFDKLIAAYVDDLPRHIYYQINKWHYQKDSMSFEQVTDAVDMLELLLNTGQLENVEIYSFVIYQLLLGLAETKDVQYKDYFVAVLYQATQHFSSIELSYSILSCYRLAVDYFTAIGDEQSAQYYQQQVVDLLHTLTR